MIAHGDHVRAQPRRALLPSCARTCWLNADVWRGFRNITHPAGHCQRHPRSPPPSASSRCSRWSFPRPAEGVLYFATTASLWSFFVLRPTRQPGRIDACVQGEPAERDLLCRLHRAPSTSSPSCSRSSTTARARGSGGVQCSLGARLPACGCRCWLRRAYLKREVHMILRKRALLHEFDVMAKEGGAWRTRVAAAARALLAS